MQVYGIKISSPELIFLAIAIVFLAIISLRSSEARLSFMSDTYKITSVCFRRLADLLVRDESFIRERVAMIYTSVASQSGGGATLMKNPLIVCNLAKSLVDRQASIRLKVAEVIEMLARNWKGNGIII